jgi:hypothetical protein
VFQFLDRIIQQDGDYLFLAFAWLSLISIDWIFNGGLRRKFPKQPPVHAGIGIGIQPHTPPSPPPLIIIDEYDPPDD